MRRCRLPPSSMGWPTLKVYWVTATLPLPNCSARKFAVGLGRSAAVISLAPTDWTSNSLARTVGLAVLARLRASARVRLLRGNVWAEARAGAPRRARQHAIQKILIINVPSVERGCATWNDLEESEGQTEGAASASEARGSMMRRLRRPRGPGCEGARAGVPRR